MNNFIAINQVESLDPSHSNIVMTRQAIEALDAAIAEKKKDIDAPKAQRPALTRAHHEARTGPVDLGRHLP